MPIRCIITVTTLGGDSNWQFYIAPVKSIIENRISLSSRKLVLSVKKADPLQSALTRFPKFIFEAIVCVHVCSESKEMKI